MLIEHWTSEEKETLKIFKTVLKLLQTYSPNIINSK